MHPKKMKMEKRKWIEMGLMEKQTTLHERKKREKRPSACRIRTLIDWLFPERKKKTSGGKVFFVPP